MIVTGSNLTFSTTRYVRQEYLTFSEVYVNGKRVWPGPKPFRMRVGEPLAIVSEDGRMDLLPKHEFENGEQVEFLCRFTYTGEYIDFISGLTDVGHWEISPTFAKVIDAEFTDEEISWFDYEWVQDTWNRIQLDEEPELYQLQAIWEQMRRWRFWMRQKRNDR